MHKNTKKLRELMKRHALSAPDVASLLGRKPNTVRVWRVTETTRPIPSETLELLRYKLGAQ